ncbi:MAG: hypothetical protein EA398_12130 [Deltaproteobacteria bacterium]|nr:MAG: hypothetical protein EA398_12130 [Deltaproteobacteria bacterium]
MRARRPLAPFCALLVALGITSTALADFEVSPSSISLPDGPGSIEGMGESLSVSPSTGQVHYTVPLALLEGPEDVSLELAVAYRPMEGNGPLGLAVDLPIGETCRNTEGGVPDWGPDDTVPDLPAVLDVRTPHGGGTFVLRNDGRYTPREGSSPHVLTVVDHGLELHDARTGTRYRFGRTPEHREGPSPDALGGTACWMLDGIADTRDREVRVDWIRDGERLYPDRIRLAEGSARPFAYHFRWEPRFDAHTDARFGFPRRTGLRLAAIEGVATGEDGEAPLGGYRFTYIELGNASRLATITREGRDGTRLPPQRLHWFVADGNDPATGSIEDAPRLDPENGDLRLVDLDGDGFPDILRARPEGWELIPNLLGERFGTAIPVAGSPSLDGATADWLLLDVNGNGLRDVLVRTGPARGETRWYRNISRPGEPAFAPSESLDLALPLPLRSAELHATDINRNGRMDFLVELDGTLHLLLSRTAPGEDGRISREDAPAWDSLAPLADRLGGEPSGVEGLDRIRLGTDVRFADLNGDGIDDLVRILGDAGGVSSILVHEQRVRGGFGPARHLELPPTLASRAPRSVQLIDVDRDGLADLVVLENEGVRLFLNRGGDHFDRETFIPRPEGASPNGRWTVADLAGEGSLAFAWISPEDGRWSWVDPIARHDHGLLVRVENGMGAVRDLVYTSTGQEARASRDRDEPWTRFIPQAFVITRTFSLDVAGAASEVQHWQYLDPVADAHTGRFATFRASRVIHESSEKEDGFAEEYLFHTGREAERIDLGPWVDDEPRHLPEDFTPAAGRLRSVVFRDLRGAVLRQVIHQWTPATTADGRDHVVESATLTLHAESRWLAPPIGHAEPLLPNPGATDPVSPWEEQALLDLTEREHDDLGMVTRLVELGFIDSRRRPLTPGARTTETTYARDGGALRLDRIAEERVLDHEGALLTAVRFRYDGETEPLSLGQADHGEVTLEERWLDTEDRWVRRMRNTRDADGRVTRIEDAHGHVLELEYDPWHGRLVSAEHILLDQGRDAEHRHSPLERLTWRSEIDPDLGQATGMQDPAGVWTRMELDGLGRPLSRTTQGIHGDEPFVTWSWHLGEPWSWVEERFASGPTGDAVQVRRTVFDGMLRETMHLHGEAACATCTTEGPWLVLDRIEYGVRGLERRRFRAFEAEDAASALTLDLERPHVTHLHDAIGRPLQVVNEDGTLSQFGYRPGLVRKWNELQHERDPHRVAVEEWIDARGNVLRRIDPPGADGGPPTELRFQHDPQDRLIATVLPDGTERTHGWDSLGRLTRVLDPNAGEQRRHFDDDDRLVAIELADGSRVERRTDAAGRLVSLQVRAGADSPLEEVARYDYDGAQDGFPANFAPGQLVRREEDGLRQWLDYDALGRVVRRFVAVEDDYVVEGFGYAPDGRVIAYRYADGTVLRPNWDRYGRIASIPGMVDEVTLRPDGLVEAVQWPNGVRLDRRWDERGRPAAHTLVGPDGDTLQDLRMTLDAVGAPLDIEDRLHTDGARSLSRTFRHDALHRPVEISGPGVGTVQYAYGPGGTLDRREVRGDRPPGADVRVLDAGRFTHGTETVAGLPAGPHQVSRVGERRLGWDRNGRLAVDQRADGERTITWDPRGQIRSVELPDGRSVHYAWDGIGGLLQRIVRDEHGERIAEDRHLGPLHELRWRNGEWTVHKTFEVEGEAIGTATGTGPLFAPLASMTESEVAPWAEGFTPVAFARPPPPLPPSAAWLLGLGLLLLAWIGSRRNGRTPTQRPVRSFRPSVLRPAIAATVLLLAGGALQCGSDDATPPTDTGSDIEMSGAPDAVEGARLLFDHVAPGLTAQLRTDEDGRVVARVAQTPEGIVTHVEGDRGDHDVRFHGSPVDDVTGYVRFGARFYDPELGTWLSPDPFVLWEGSAEFELNAGEWQGMSFVAFQFSFRIDLTGLSLGPLWGRGTITGYISGFEAKGWVQFTRGSGWSADFNAGRSGSWRDYLRGANVKAELALGQGSTSTGPGVIALGLEIPFPTGIPMLKGKASIELYVDIGSGQASITGWKGGVSASVEINARGIGRVASLISAIVNFDWSNPMTSAVQGMIDREVEDYGRANGWSSQEIQSMQKRVGLVTSNYMRNVENTIWGAISATFENLF